MPIKQGSIQSIKLPLGNGFVTIDDDSNSHPATISHFSDIYVNVKHQIATFVNFERQGA